MAAVIKKQRALEAAVSNFDTINEGSLAATLERLEATASDAINRWSTPDDFAKVDLVVTKLLQEGNVDAALTYVRKVRFCQLPQSRLHSHTRWISC